MQVGERYTLQWKLPHFVECEVKELGQDFVIVDAVHRCPVTCYLLQMRGTLPIEGSLRFRYADFDKLFVRIPDGSMALPAAR